MIWTGSNPLATPQAVALLDVDEVKRRLRERAGNVRALFARHPEQARRVLAELLRDKLDAHSVEAHGRRGYRLVGDVNVAAFSLTYLRDARRSPNGRGTATTMVAPPGDSNP